MKIATTHTNTDFDALASLLAVKKLYPDIELFLPGILNKNVSAFLALYKDVFSFKDAKFFPTREEIELLVLVDTNNIERTGSIAAGLQSATIEEIHLYDHHELQQSQKTYDYILSEPVGATTTLLVEIIAEREIALNEMEATLLGLGIYEDTGSLTQNVNIRDVRAMLYLWENGLNIRIVNEFLRRPLTDRQKQTLEELMTRAEYYEIKGVRVFVASIETEEYLHGMAVLAQKIMEFEDVQAVFIIINDDQKIMIIARSDSQLVKVQNVLSALGGKGHEGAASAIIKTKNIELAELKEQLVKTLYREIAPTYTVEDLMSTPVKTVNEKMTVDEVYSKVEIYGHSGFPVVNDDNLLTGVISRRDLEKAKRHGLGHSSVRGYMSKNIKTVSKDTAIENILDIMVKHDLGRLPIINSNGELQGIVTRTDMINYMHSSSGKNNSYKNQVPDKIQTNISNLFNERLNGRILGLLFLIGQKGDLEGYEVYAVGGFVRDLFLNQNNEDIDLAVEGNAIAFAEKLHQMLGGKIIKHEEFGTASLLTVDGINIDLATARQEFYATPASLPQVEKSVLKIDLFRRDFTVNTLAVQLNTRHFGRFFDFYHGGQDLKKGIIRVLYNLSFVEDPLRIIRALRFKVRFDFTLEGDTLNFMENAIKTKVLLKVSKERLYQEFRYIFNEKDPYKIIMLMNDLSVLPMLIPGYNKIQENSAKILQEISSYVNWAKNKLCEDFNVMIIYLCGLFWGKEKRQVVHLSCHLRLGKKERSIIYDTIENTENVLLVLSKEKVKPSELYNLLEPLPLETHLFVLAISKSANTLANYLLYRKITKGTEIFTTGEDIKKLGLEPGPQYKEILAKVKEAKLDGIVKTPEEEIEYIKDVIISAD